MCRFPFDVATEWACPKCKQHKPRTADGHTLVPGECKLATAGTRRGLPRSGHHPREPRRPASSEPTAAMPPNTEDDEEPETVEGDPTIRPADSSEQAVPSDSLDYQQPEILGRRSEWRKTSSGDT